MEYILDDHDRVKNNYASMQNLKDSQAKDWTSWSQHCPATSRTPDSQLQRSMPSHSAPGDEVYYNLCIYQCVRDVHLLTSFGWGQAKKSINNNSTVQTHIIYNTPKSYDAPE